MSLFLASVRRCFAVRTTETRRQLSKKLKPTSSFFESSELKLTPELQSRVDVADFKARKLLDSLDSLKQARVDHTGRTSKQNDGLVWMSYWLRQYFKREGIRDGKVFGVRDIRAIEKVHLATDSGNFSLLC
jgi:hypothetical protein